jgi:hypothetical protein
MPNSSWLTRTFAGSPPAEEGATGHSVFGTVKLSPPGVSCSRRSLVHSCSFLLLPAFPIGDNPFRGARIAE